LNIVVSVPVLRRKSAVTSGANNLRVQVKSHWSDSETIAANQATSTQPHSATPADVSYGRLTIQLWFSSTHIQPVMALPSSIIGIF